MQNNVDLKIFFKALWNHVILVKVISLLKENKDFFAKLRNKYRELEKYIDKYEAVFSQMKLLIQLQKYFKTIWRKN